VLFETLTKGSADSFVLRNHGMKSLLPDRHPTAAGYTREYYTAVLRVIERRGP
jgi:hypothetical protein